MSKQKKKPLIELKNISVDLIAEPEWNPNEQSPDTFNMLVENIRDHGFLEPVVVSERKDKPGHYLSISGSHRLKAARILEIEEIPCVVKNEFDEDMQKFQNMRFNVIKGKLDPLKFTSMYNQLSAKYGAEATKAMMAFTDNAAFDAVYQQTKAALPKEMKDELDKAKAEIKSIDGLAGILNEMFQKYGGSLEKGYMVFSYGGQSHLWIIMDKDMKAVIDKVKKKSMEMGMNVNEVFREMLDLGPVTIEQPMEML